MTASPPATPPAERVTGRREAALVALLLGPVALVQVGGLFVGLAVLSAGAELAASTERVAQAGAELVQRVHDASPLVGELTTLEVDAARLRHSLAALETPGEPGEATEVALRFVADAHTLATPLTGRDDHDVRLVRQRLARLRDARDTLREVWGACVAVRERPTGRWARRFGVTGAACLSMGEP